MELQELYDAVYTELDSIGITLSPHRPKDYNVPEPIAYVSNLSETFDTTKEFYKSGEIVFAFIVWSNADDVIGHSELVYEMVKKLSGSFQTEHYRFQASNMGNFMIIEDQYIEQDIRTGTINIHWKWSARG